MVALPCRAQAHVSADPAGTPRSWVEAAAQHQLRVIDDDGSFPLRYRVHKVDLRNDVTRDTIESRQGTVARLIERNGKPLTPAEDAAERQRLADVLSSPADFAKHHHHDDAARNYSKQLVRDMPRAEIFTYAPGQPQIASPAGPQVVIDFKPDPGYHPPAMIDNALTGIEGRLWIDRATQHVVRIAGRITRPVDFGWGMLARIYAGGVIEFDQTPVGGGRWAYAHLSEDLTIREVLVKTAHQRGTTDATAFQILPASVSLEEAVHALLDTPIPLSR